ncbi:hypothetical protein Q667_00950 [Marinobacter sp. C1S70]|nr:hypothetical protein Q667_00950 [Marinobacter sp. C1S70]
MDLALPDYEIAGWKATGIHADIVNSVEASNKQVGVTFRPGSRLTIARIARQSGSTPAELIDVQLDLADTEVAVDLGAPGAMPERTRISGNVRIDVAEIRHPSLKPQRWWFQGETSGTLADLKLEGTLNASSGLTADLVLRNQLASNLAAHISTTMAAQNAGEALAATLLNWPELLALDSGELTLQANLRLNST